jgi:uncharacterized damage-inducible protein DinB
MFLNCLEAKLMKRVSMVLGLILASCLASLAQSADQKKTVPSVLDGTVKIIESELVPAAEAMPEDKYGFAPTNGEFKDVRTFAEQLKHVAAVNYIVGAAILGEKPPVDIGGEKGPDGVKTKADILKFLKDSYAYAHKAVASITEANAVEPIKNPFGKESTTRLGMATVFAWHGFDHYGQMVVYLRTNGIVPPASRR